jgi:hypothetical protein
MKKLMKYMSGFNMFAAGVMLVLMVEEFKNGNAIAVMLSAVIMAGNLYSYFDIQNRRDQNESLR